MSTDIRNERQGNGNGRVYTINFAVSDDDGNVASASTQVTVPKNQSNPVAVDDGASYTVDSECTP